MEAAIFHSHGKTAKPWSDVLKELGVDSKFFTIVCAGKDLVSKVKLDIIVLESTIKLVEKTADLSNISKRVNPLIIGGVYFCDFIRLADPNRTTPIVYTSFRPKEESRDITSVFSKFPNTHFFYERDPKGILYVVQPLLNLGAQ